MVGIKRNVIIGLSLCIVISVFWIAKSKYVPREVYVNRKYGFTVTGPKDWRKQLGSRGSKGIVVFIESFDTTLPRLGVTIDKAGDAKTVLKYANLTIRDLKNKARKRQLRLRILERPHEITINGIKGAKFIYEIAGLIDVKHIDCKFMKKGLVFSVMGASYSDDFKNYLKDFENTINSFSFLKK
ncbi:MAG: hypothetical protein JSW17_06280 [Candidatus Omnitrophota bacterium]|nr:MAG: hypothetical protein JSW17_06280 [Candidatus Omnitrophota bacterium]